MNCLSKNSIFRILTFSCIQDIKSILLLNKNFFALSQENSGFWREEIFRRSNLLSFIYTKLSNEDFEKKQNMNYKMKIGNKLINGSTFFYFPKYKEEERSTILLQSSKYSNLILEKKNACCAFGILAEYDRFLNRTDPNKNRFPSEITIYKNCQSTVLGVDGESSRVEHNKVYHMCHVIFGSTKSGKTSLFKSYMKGGNINCNQYLPTKTNTFARRRVDFQKNKKRKEVEYCLFDTTNDNQFSIHSRITLSQKSGIMICLDLSNFNSIKFLKDCFRDIISFSPTANICLVGCKSDVENRKISRKIVESLAKTLGLNYFETSAKTKEGINAPFEYLIDETLKNHAIKKRRKKAMNNYLLNLIKLKRIEKKNKCCVIQ